MRKLTTRVQGIPLGLQAAQVLRLLIDEKLGRFDFGLVVGLDSTSWCRCLYCDGHRFLALMDGLWDSVGLCSKLELEIDAYAHARHVTVTLVTIVT